MNFNLNLLREFPAQTCRDYCFVAPENLSSLTTPSLWSLGFNCCVIGELHKSNFVKLSVMAGGGDYFFPYIPGGVGSCVVPFGCPKGTLVITSAMNGCSLQVDAFSNHYRFFHDANGSFCNQNIHTVCRINDEHYAGPAVTHGTDSHHKIGQKIAIALQNRKLYWENTLICVKGNKGNGWGIYNCGLFKSLDGKEIKEKISTIDSPLILKFGND